MFTPEECSALLTLINRVQVQGAEAEQVVYLKNKLRSGSEPKPTKDADKTSGQVSKSESKK